MVAQPNVVALIPARAGSKRVQGKNVRLLNGHPLLAYTIAAARASGVFAAVMVSTDAAEYAEIARHYGAEVPFMRPDAFAGDTSPDIDWLYDMLVRLREGGRSFDCFSILRPTSPFRQPETIQRAWATFLAADGVDSLRAVEKCKQHPGKMWVVRNERLLPLMPFGPAGLPWHSTPYQALPEIFVQNASLEIGWTRIVFETHTIAGETLVPFPTEGFEGFDINDEKDWWYAQHLIAQGDVQPPPIV